MKREITLSAKELHIGYKLKGKEVKSVHSNLNLNLYKGEVTCLLGLNGAGKSTLLRTLTGFQPALGGTIELLGKEFSSFSQRELSLTVGVVLTEKTNAGGITVYELVSLGRHPHTGFFGELKEEDHRVVEESIKAVGIAHKALNYVSELSDGERQKVMIAKALAQQCPIIILDEPTAFLDVTSRIETMVLLQKLAHEQNKTILLSTHDLDLAIQMADSLWLQRKGSPLYCGAPEDLILGGKLSTFFNRNNITFDNLQGKLNTSIPNNFIAVSGSELLVNWVTNALFRWGYKATSPSAEYTQIICHAADKFEIQFTNGESEIAQSVAQIKEKIIYSNGKK